MNNMNMKVRESGVGGEEKRVGEGWERGVGRGKKGGGKRKKRGGKNMGKGKGERVTIIL